MFFLLFYNFGHWGEIAKNLRLILNEYFRPNAAKLAENNLAKPILVQIFLPFLMPLFLRLSHTCLVEIPPLKCKATNNAIYIILRL